MTEESKRGQVTKSSTNKRADKGTGDSFIPDRQEKGDRRLISFISSEWRTGKSHHARPDPSLWANISQYSS